MDLINGQILHFFISSNLLHGPGVSNGISE